MFMIFNQSKNMAYLILTINGGHQLQKLICDLDKLKRILDDILNQTKSIKSIPTQHVDKIIDDNKNNIKNLQLGDKKISKKISKKKLIFHIYYKLIKCALYLY